VPAPPELNAADIDAMVRTEWAKAGVTPAPRADDARWLRRVYLDVVGTIPPPEAALAFASDASPDKRARVVDQLLASPAYADHWTNYWEDALMGQVREGAIDRAAFRAWLHDRFAANEPWNKLVFELLTASGQNSAGGPRDPVTQNAPAGSPTAMHSPSTSDDPAETAKPVAVNGAVNWILRFRDNPQDFAGSASRVFLGVQIQCAQCHDHKTEKWKQTDFRSFAACFARTRSLPVDRGKVMGIRRVDVEDIGRPLPRYVKNPDQAPVAASTPKTLDGADLSTTPNVRAALAAWLIATDNPWFAQEIVNRTWGHFLGRGFVDPVDDLRPSNPATMPELLSRLTRDFVDHGYDLKRLVRLLTATEVYGLAAQKAEGTTPEAAQAQERLWARFRMQPLGPEELLNALLAATDVERELRRSGWVNLPAIRAQLFRQYTFLFDVDEDEDQPDFEGTVAQALSLLNGSLVGGGTSSLPGSALAQVLAQAGSDADRIEALYLRTLSRKPTDKELAYWSSYVSSARVDPVPPATQKQGKGPGHIPALERIQQRAAAGSTDPRRQAFEDLFWALLNSSEFVFNH